MRKIVSMITLYNPNDDMIENINLVAEQSDIVILCDNSKNKHEELANKKNNIKYVWLKENCGLSKAFNFVLKDEMYNYDDEDYIVFFDQDSRIEPGHISHLIEEYENLFAKGYQIGCIGPAFYNKSNGRVEIPKLHEKISETCMKVGCVITSSMLCRYGDLKKIGFWNENIFLDMADWDLCWRLIDSGKECFMTNKVILRHSVGEGEKRVGPFSLRVGKPFREYYQIRDCLYLIKERYTPIKYKCRFLLMVSVRSMLHVLFLNNKLERVRYIGSAIRDYCKGIHGEYQN